MIKRKFLVFAAASFLMTGLACTSQRSNTRANNQNATNPNDVSYKDSVKKALEAADLKDVTVDEDKDKNTITLGGKLHSENAKQQAAEVARAAAGPRVIANEILVEAVGQESTSRSIQSNLDSAIEKNYKAALESKGLDRARIRYQAKNGVLTLKGSVKNPQQKQEAQEIATSIPNVQQVLNQIEIRR